MRSLAIILALSLFSSHVLGTSADEVKGKTSEAAAAAADYSKEQKEAFQRDMEAKLAAMKKEIADMKAAASQKTGEAQKGWNEQIAILEKKQEEMKKDLSKMKKSSGKAWAEMKTGMNKAWDVISESYDKAKSQFKTNE